MTSTAVSSSARDLTPKELEQRAIAAHKLQEKVKSGLRAGREALWSLAEALHQFDDESGWTSLGYETLGEWLADPDIGLTRSTYYRLIRSWRGLVVNRQVTVPTLQQLDPSKVDIVLPAVENGKALLKAALEDVKSLGARDLREKYNPKPPEEGKSESEPENGKAIEVDAEPVAASAVADSEPKDGEGEPAEAEVVEPAKKARARKEPDLGPWIKLREVLVEAEVSGAAHPRIDLELIGPGLKALALVIPQWKESRKRIEKLEAELAERGES